MTDVAIQTRGLAKTYRAKAGNVAAVQDLNLSISAGEIFGLLGPNGAGKTTTIRMLCGLIRPSAGEVWVNGLPLSERSDEVRRRIGLVPEEAGDHKSLTLAEELDYHGALYNLDRATIIQRSRPLIERLGLGDRMNHQLKTFSKGMRRKFHLIRALLHEPRVLLLDEPTAGLDPAIVEEVWDLLKALTAERRVTVILCSHHLEEVERLCTRVAIIKQRLLAEGTLAALSGGERCFRVELDTEADGAGAILSSIPGVRGVEVEGHRLRFEIDGEAAVVVPQVVRRLVESGAGIVEVARNGRDLRSLYRSIVEEPAERAQEAAR